MSKWTDPDIMKSINKQMEMINTARSTMTEEQIEEIMPEVIKHHKKHMKDNEIFEHQTGVIIWFEMPKLQQKPKPLEKKTESGKTIDAKFRISCRTKLGWVGFFGWWTNFWSQCEGSKVYWAWGKLNTQYDIVGTWGTGKQYSKRQYFKTLEKACEETGTDIDNLDEDDIMKSYTFEAWQNMG